MVTIEVLDAERVDVLSEPEMQGTRTRARFRTA